MSKNDCETQTVIQKGKKGEAESSIKEEKAASRMEIAIERYVDERKEAMTEKGRSKGDIVETGFFGEASHRKRRGKHIERVFGTQDIAFHRMIMRNSRERSDASINDN